MAQIIRKDLDGVVTAGRFTLQPGDAVPNGVTVDESLVESGTAGAGDGPTVATDPGAFSVDDVNSYLDEHPDDVAAVLAAETAGKARKGIVEGPHAA